MGGHCDCGSSIRVSDFHKVGSKVGLYMRWRVRMSWLDQMRKQLRVIQIKLDHSNFPKSIERVRKTISISQHD